MAKTTLVTLPLRPPTKLFTFLKAIKPNEAQARL
jgi:hypothetical protein